MSTQPIYMHGSAATGAHTALNGLVRALANASDTTPLVTPGVFQRWKITLDAAPGVGTSLTFTLQKANVDTALTVTISGTDTTGSDTVNTVSFAAGDTIRINTTASGSPASATFIGSMEFIPTTPGQHVYEFSADLTNAEPDAGVISETASLAAGTYGTRHIIPTTGNARAMRVRSRTAPNGGGTFVYWLTVNGVKQDGTGGTVDTTTTIATGATTADSTFTLPLSPGDLLNVKYLAVGGISGSLWDCGTIVFEGSTVEETVFGLTNSSSGPSTTLTRYAYPRSTIGSAGEAWTATEASISYEGPAVSTLRLGAIYADVSVAPGSGNSWTFSVRKNGATTALAAVISDTATTGNGTGAVYIAPGDTWAIQSLPASGPASTLARVSVLIGLVTAGVVTQLNVSP